jgi:hypothetical protein
MNKGTTLPAKDAPPLRNATLPCFWCPSQGGGEISWYLGTAYSSYGFPSQQQQNINSSSSSSGIGLTFLL